MMSALEFWHGFNLASSFGLVENVFVNLLKTNKFSVRKIFQEVISISYCIVSDLAKVGPFLKPTRPWPCDGQNIGINID